ncbi:MAG TPA: Rnase Y domain-containing protein, partial [Candidatus Omnitrophota bacterium]|nr:Rnase Y domain-containing protein [Candidatus Omnitrophota bacterium]
MNFENDILLTAFASFGLGIFLGILWRTYFANKRIREAEDKARKLKEFAEREAETHKKEAELAGKDMMIKLRQEFEKETKTRRDELVVLEKRLHQKEENIEKRVDLLEKKEKDIEARIGSLRKDEDRVKMRDEELSKLIDEEKKRLQEMSSMTSEQAKDLLLKRMDEEIVQE